MAEDGLLVPSIHSLEALGYAMKNWRKGGAD